MLVKYCNWFQHSGCTVIVRPYRGYIRIGRCGLLLPNLVAWTVCRSVCRSVTLVSPAETVEPIEMPFNWTVDSDRPKEAKFNRICKVAPVCPHARLYLANAIEPSACGGGAAVCQITLTTTY